MKVFLTLVLNFPAHYQLGPLRILLAMAILALG